MVNTRFQVVRVVALEDTIINFHMCIIIFVVIFFSQGPNAYILVILIS
jgi:hypothetical protein